MDQFDAIIVAAGSGTRLGFDIHKAFVPLARKPILAYSLETFTAHPSIERVILVVPAGLTLSIEDLSTRPITLSAMKKYEWLRAAPNAGNRY